MQVDIAKPVIGDPEIEAVVAVLRSGRLIQGPLVAQFETRFAQYHGASFGVAVCNGTVALTAALMAHGIGPGDEVLVPAFSFFATASSMLSVGARPVFVDIDEQSFNLDVDDARSKIGPRTRAIMPVHLYGLPADMEAIATLASEHGLALLEDSAQAHGARIGRRSVGTWGTAAFSFYPSKNMTTSEGGMVLTNDAGVAERLRLIRNQGMSAQYQHELLGFNFRMTELCAAIGLQQLERTDRRRRHDSHGPRGMRALRRARLLRQRVRRVHGQAQMEVRHDRAARAARR